MMELQNQKEWYLKQQDFHHGPYDDHEIETYIQKAKFLYTKDSKNLINDQTFLWKEGLKSWVKLEDYYKLAAPEIPLAPGKLELKAEVVPSTTELPEIPQFVDNDAIAEIELLFGDKKHEEVKLLDETVELPPLPKLEKSKPKKIEKTEPYGLKIIYLIFLLVMVKYAYDWLETPRMVLPEYFSPKVKKELSRVLNSPYEKLVEIEAYFDKTNNSLWVTSNLDRAATLNLTLTSVDGEILSNDKVVLTSNSSLKHHVAKFDEFIFEQGKKLYPGYYQVKVEFVMQDYIWWEKFFSAFAREVLVKEKRILIGSENDETFQKDKAEYKKSVNLVKNSFLDDLEQKYSTLIILLTKIDESFFSKFHAINKGSEIAEFESQYTVETGTMLSNMNLDNYKAIEKAGTVNQLLVKEYDELTQGLKKVGAVTMEMIFKTKEKNYLTKQFKATMTSNFKNQITELQKNFQSKINSIESLKN
ncbi:MAG: hypothetical protein U0T83_05325 [Bacteriovoracaceae bacterium]